MLGANPAFLLEALKVMEPQAKVRFDFTNGKAPGKLSDGDDYVYVVMPIALAVLRLMMNSKRDGCSIGRSPGLAPPRMRET